MYIFYTYINCFYGNVWPVVKEGTQIWLINIVKAIIHTHEPFEHTLNPPSDRTPSGVLKLLEKWFSLTCPPQPNLYLPTLTLLTSLWLFLNMAKQRFLHLVLMSNKSQGRLTTLNNNFHDHITVKPLGIYLVQFSCLNYLRSCQLCIVCEQNTD